MIEIAKSVPCPVWKAPCVTDECIKLGHCKYQSVVGHSAAAGTKPVTATVPPVPAQKVLPIVTQCHTDLYQVGRVGNATIWLGREAGVYQKAPNGNLWALQVSLLGAPRFSSSNAIVSGNDEARAIFPPSVFIEVSPTPELYIEWPDYGIPLLSQAWWIEFVSNLAKVDGDVVIYCQGGHGRTGTAASIIAALVGWSGEGCPVSWVRSVYCKECVETDEQAHYIEAITGRTVTAVIKSWGGAYAGYIYSSNHWQTHEGRPNKLLPLSPLEPTLSKNQYKKLVKAGKQEPLHKLEDGTEVLVDGEWFVWDKPKKCFEWIGEEVGYATATASK